MTTVGTAQVEFWFATGDHVHHYLNGVLTTVPNPDGDYIPHGTTSNGKVHLQRADSAGPVGYVASDPAMSDLTLWGPYDDDPTSHYTIGGETWTRFQDRGVGVCRIGADIFVSVLMELDSTIPPGDNGVGAGVLLNGAGELQLIVGRNTENLIQGQRNNEGVSFDVTRSRIWINNETRGLQYVDYTTNQLVEGPISGVSFYNGARWIEYQESTDTLWVTYNKQEILGLNPDDFTTKTTVPFCSSPSSDDGPYSAEVFCILPNDTHMVVAGEGGLETDFNDGLWLVEIATGTKELVLGLDGSEDYWIFSDAFICLWAADEAPIVPNLAGQLDLQRQQFWRTSPGLGQTA